MRPAVSSYEDLEVWQVAMNVAEDCYNLTSGLPTDERFGMTAQMRRAAVSILSTFLRIAHGSTRELETQLQLAVRLKLTATDMAQAARQRCASVSEMLRSLIRRLDGGE